MSEATPGGSPPRSRTGALVAGAIAIAAVSVGATVLIEHRLHPADRAEAHGPGDDEAKHPDHSAEQGEGRVELSAAMIDNAKLEILTAAPGKVAVTLSLPGEIGLDADRVAHVAPRVEGSVREVKKNLGDAVKKGDVLAVLDSRELAEMQRELAAAKERLGLAEATFKRQDQLWQEKISAEKDYLAAKQALAEAKIEYGSAAQKLAAGAGAGNRGSGLTLVAPLDGTIIEKHAVVGEVLKDDTLAFVIADLSSVWVNVSVYAKDLSRVSIGQRAFVRADGIEQPITGTIAYVDRVVGEQTRSATARIVLRDPGAAWRPGLFVTADLVVQQADADVVVSHEAVQTLEGKDVVFVQEGGGFAARRVRLGRRGLPPEGQQEPVAEVEAGVSAGERYVARNSFVLKAELGKSEAGHEH